MTALENKAYLGGSRMAAYIIRRDGLQKAMMRGSKAEYRYSRRSLIESYNAGYMDAVIEAYKTVRD